MRYFILLFLWVFSNLNAHCIHMADSLISALSLEEKVSLLFVVEPVKELNDTVYLNNYMFDNCAIKDTRNGFKDSIALDYPNSQTLTAVDNIELKHKLYTSTLHSCAKKGYNGIMVPDSINNVARIYLSDEAIKNDDFIRVADVPCTLFDQMLIDEQKHNVLKQRKLSDLIRLIGMPSLAIWVDYPRLSVSLNTILEQNVLFWKVDDKQCTKLLASTILKGHIDEGIIDKRIEELVKHATVSEDVDSVTDKSHKQLLARLECYQSSISMYQKAELLPIKRLDTLKYSIDNFTRDAQEFTETIQFYHPNIGDGEKLGKIHFVLVDNSFKLRSNIKKFKALNGVVRNNILVCLGAIDTQAIELALPYFDAMICMPEKIPESWSMLAQCIYGGIPCSGVSLYHRELVNSEYKRVISRKDRLGLQHALMTSLSTDSVGKIDSIINDAIKQKATPGGQLLIVKGGDIILQENYGYHTYSKRRKVVSDDLYDVASITKLAVTFPLVMQMYDEQLISLDAKLKDYISKIDTTDKANITIEELLLHQSGLISYIPFHYKALDEESLNNRSLYSRHYSWLHNIRIDKQLYQNKNAKYKKYVFSKSASEDYKRQLTANMFMNESFVDTMYRYIYETPLRQEKTYRYSDLGYYLLQQVMEQEEGEQLDTMFYNRISKPMGAGNLLFKPLNKVSKDLIVPSENDLGFRRELLHGYVHDQGAAMLGGVAAHAGLFANATDLAKLAQMLLNEGQYGGVQFIKAKTVGRFTQTVHTANRRGLGVDKPESEPGKNSHVSHSASPSSYGHTGFTGTILWVDPEYDLIYIFLSNRIHPRSYNKKLIEMNVRTKIQDVIYNSIKPI